MEFVRPVDEKTFGRTPFPECRNKFVAYLESVTVIASHIGPGGCGPSLHYHSNDQIYFMLEGETDVQLGHDIHRAVANSMVFVPAGVAHCNRNNSDAHELHFELIVPTIRPGLPLLTFVDSPDQAPGSDVAPWISALDEDAFKESANFKGFALQRMADETKGVKSCLINAAQVAPGRAGPGTHVHDFDQLYFVLSGELHVEVGLQRHVAKRHTLVVLPAGVPHRQWNEGPEPERHLAILVPPPEADKPWDYGVSFAATGEHLTG